MWEIWTTNSEVGITEYSFLKLTLLLTPGFASRRDSSEALTLHPTEAAGGWEDHAAGDTRGRGREQEEHGEAGLHFAGPGQHHL